MRITVHITSFCVCLVVLYCLFLIFLIFFLRAKRGVSLYFFQIDYLTMSIFSILCEDDDGKEVYDVQQHFFRTLVHRKSCGSGKSNKVKARKKKILSIV